MLIYENERFCQEINSDFVCNSFLACFRPNQTKTLVLEEKFKLSCQNVFTASWADFYENAG
jgi:hypothetical protein